MPPFDDQLILDVVEAGTVTYLNGSTASVAAVTVDEQGVQTLMAGLLSVVARDALITMGFTQCPVRPQEGGSYTAADGMVWKFVSVIKRPLGSFWEIIGRNFAVPGGLTETGHLYRRNSTGMTAAGLNNPTWSAIESSVYCRVVYDAQGMEAGYTPMDTMIAARVILQGFREIRAGDRFVLASAPSTNWNVDGAEPYDIALGAQILNISQRK